jgi:hypothetical protein|tara:strand:+ start:1044 stop:1232 length:189 start_codon:yes stop_codon:yes gene_type:complete
VPKRKITATTRETERVAHETPVEPVTKRINTTELMHKTISNLTDVVSKLQHDVVKIKTRLGL